MTTLQTLKALGGSLECSMCHKMKSAAEFVRPNFCKSCREILAEAKAGVRFLPRSPDQRISAAKQLLGAVANKNQNLVLAKAAQIATKELSYAYQKHPRLTKRALQRVRATEGRPSPR